MTALQLYNAVLVEMNKTDAPSLLLEDFNYLANKAINNYVNKRYNIYDVSQQTTDDLRVLKASAILDVYKTEDYEGLGELLGATYEVRLPSDYLHILNCICFYKVVTPYKCYTPGYVARAQATRLTADLYSQVVDNMWTRPTYKRPYYYIHNVNVQTVIPTDPIRPCEMTPVDSESSNEIKFGTDANGYEIINPDARGSDIIKVNYDSSVPGNVGINTKDPEDGSSHSVSTIERAGQIRYGNVSQPRMEIRYGTDDQTVFQLYKVLIDYIKVPQHILITQEQLDTVADTSQVLEFPDYVCQEIVNELVHIIMENISDPRLQTHPIVSQSIANPVQQQTSQPAASAAQ